ncbi:alpha/beta hydrolase [Psychrobacter sp. FDAARGOS_221]|nr:alpha/beta hydrolase [Psychrobacter sp. FDAARGOS_221]
MTACNTVSVSEKNASRTIVQQRDNIVTKNSLSNKSASVLVSMGVPANQCYENFDACIAKVHSGVLNTNSRESLALFAELYMARARQIQASEDCVSKILRPPIDPYYANAPMTPEDNLQRMQYLRQCNTDYRDNLLSAIKYSYAYLFYDQLTAHNNTNNSDQPEPGNLITDLDIQTQDVYEAATDALIKQLYANKDHSQQVAKMTSFISPKLVDDSKTAMSNSAKRKDNSQYGEQLKVLNFTFPPINEDPYFDELMDHLDNTSKEEEAEEVAQSIKEDQQKYNLGTKTVSLDVYLPNEPEYLQNTQTHNKSIDELYASHDLSFSGLNTISEREGFGVSYVTLFDERLNTSVAGLIRANNNRINAEDPKDRIHLTGNLLLSAVISPHGETLAEVLDSHDFDLRLYNPYHTKVVDILGKPYYLAANFSASYGMWLAENRLDNVGYFNLLAKQQTLTQPQLFMLEPYDPNKRVIIMLHGLASSPATWVSVTNDISNDPKLRDNYQVWQIFYATNIPMLENRYRIQELIETAFEMNDPNAEHIASHNTVLIGHSMGAVIGRMMVSNENLEANFKRLAEGKRDREISDLLDTQFDEMRIKNRLHLKKLDSVDTAVFISAPFRGTDFADRWFTQLLRRVVQLPLGFAQTIKGNLTSIVTEGELVENPMGALIFENGASQLSDKSSFMKLTSDLKIADDVTYHSIIANRDSDLYQGLMRLNITSQPETALSDKPAPSTEELTEKTASIGSESISEEADEEKVAEMKSKEDESSLTKDIAQSLSPNISDGIVPYSSSHLEGAASETIISGGHGIHESPEAVLTLRKILHQHLRDHPVERRDE